MSIIVTGGAGFIGSCMVRVLNDHGITDIIIVDHIASTDEWLNLSNKQYIEYIHKDELFERWSRLGDIEAVIHLGACSSTTERDFDYLNQNNFGYSRTLWEYCAKLQIPFLYASSAATYGDGTKGFDDTKDIRDLRPLNGYGYSKQIFDLWVERQLCENKKCPPHWAGFKFFNVYGPNEYFKGSMASMVFHGYKQIKEMGKVRLFKSYNPDYQNGEQLRDFIYVKDVCNVLYSFLTKECKTSGIFNVGTGKAQSFQTLAEATFHALGLEPRIEYIDMPENLKEKYQYYTEANIDRLRAAGYCEKFYDLEKGVADYVCNYLDRNASIY